MKHNDIIDSLENRLIAENHGLVIGREEEYCVRQIHGECDLYMVNPYHNKAKVFEIKTKNNEHSRNKACIQLYKDLVFIDDKYNIQNIKRYYVYGEKGKIILERQDD